MYVDGIATYISNMQDRYKGQCTSTGYQQEKHTKFILFILKLFLCITPISCARGLLKEGTQSA